MEQQRITFLGLGAMGRRMARRLVDAGHHVTVWNRSPSPAVALATQGAQAASSPREAVQGAHVVIGMVLDDAASRGVWLDPAHGAAPSMSRDALAIECSTLTPTWIGELSQALAARGIGFVDAPLAGSRPQADAGQLIFMAGGDAARVERAKPVLMSMGAAVHHVGSTGSGAWLKLAVNTLFATQVAAMAEQLALLRAAGVDVQRALAALKPMPVTSPAAAGAAALMLAHDFTPQFPVSLVTKDLGYALHSAQGMGVETPLARTVAQRFEAARAAGLGGENIVAVAKLYA